MISIKSLCTVQQSLVHGLKTWKRLLLQHPPEQRNQQSTKLLAMNKNHAVWSMLQLEIMLPIEQSFEQELSKPTKLNRLLNGQNLRPELHWPATNRLHVNQQGLPRLYASLQSADERIPLGVLLKIHQHSPNLRRRSANMDTGFQMVLKIHVLSFKGWTPYTRIAASTCDASVVSSG